MIECRPRRVTPLGRDDIEVHLVGRQLGLDPGDMFGDLWSTVARTVDIDD